MGVGKIDAVIELVREREAWKRQQGPLLLLLELSERYWKPCMRCDADVEAAECTCTEGPAIHEMRQAVLNARAAVGPRRGW